MRVSTLHGICRILLPALLLAAVCAANGVVFAAEPETPSAEISTPPETDGAAHRSTARPQVPARHLTQRPDDIVNATQLIKVLIALVITVAAILGLSALARKARLGRIGSGQHLRVIDSLAVGTRDRIMLVAVENQRIVVAATPGQIRPLHAFDAPESKSFEQVMNDSIDLVKEAGSP